MARAPAPSHSHRGRRRQNRFGRGANAMVAGAHRPGLSAGRCLGTAGYICARNRRHCETADRRWMAGNSIIMLRDGHSLASRRWYWSGFFLRQLIARTSISGGRRPGETLPIWRFSYPRCRQSRSIEVERRRSASATPARFVTGRRKHLWRRRSAGEGTIVAAEHALRTFRAAADNHRQRDGLQARQKNRRRAIPAAARRRR